MSLVIDDIWNTGSLKMLLNDSVFKKIKSDRLSFITEFGLKNNQLMKHLLRINKSVSFSTWKWIRCLMTKLKFVYKVHLFA